MAAILGISAVMQAAQSSFISSTYWTERIGPVAALATIRKHRKLQAPRRLIALGERVSAAWRAAADAARVEIEISGIAPLTHFSFAAENAAALKTLFNQEMLERGFLAAPAFYAMWAHTDEHVAAYAEAAGEVFREIGVAQREGKVEERLRGPVAHTGFRRLT
jgi:glutamate-1-semialdehyde 2,1-aminomutase